MTVPSPAAVAFPRRSARTRRFTLGAPRTLSVTPDGGLVVFLRSAGPEDPVHALWALDVAAGEERLLADPRALLADPDDAELPVAERARRERTRESGEGIVAYDLAADGGHVAVALAGRLFLVDLGTGAVVALDTAPGVFSPQVAPDGSAAAYVAAGALRLVGPGFADRVLVAEDDADVSWGVAEFIAAEELDRGRGTWWSPDGTRLAAARVDERPVARWHIAAPVEPWREPSAVRYPAAGTANAEVSLWVVDRDGQRREVVWDRAALPYLLDVAWRGPDRLDVVLSTRDQRTLVVLDVDADTGLAVEAHRHDDPAFIEVVPGTPTRIGERLLLAVDRDGARRLVLDGEPITPVTMQVRAVVDADTERVIVTASSDDPTEIHVWRIGLDGSAEPISTAPGVHGARAAGGTLALSSATPDVEGTTVEVRSGDRPPVGLASSAATSGLEPEVRFLALGERGLRAALMLPPGLGADERVPVLLDPYGGPHAQRVLRSRSAHLGSWWFAEQGFAVLVIDGRGTPGRGPEWERAVRGDLAGPVLDDQVDGLRAAAVLEPRLDLGRVGIRGWSFGGYLAALAVLRRPDVFHAAVAGAPVTDWRLYDTAYTERYLGHPATDPAAYERTDLTPLAPDLERPLLLIHGLADDNVVAAHTLQLSRALLEAGRPHSVLPLSGVTHMTPQEAVAENLLVLQVDFLRRALSQVEPVGRA